MTLMDGLELYICVILTIEFVYDYYWNTREQRIKRRKKLEKAQKPRSEAPISHTPNLEPKQGTPGNP